MIRMQETSGDYWSNDPFREGGQERAPWDQALRRNSFLPKDTASAKALRQKRFCWFGGSEWKGGRSWEIRSEKLIQKQIYRYAQWNTIQPQKKNNVAICSNMVGLGGHLYSLKYVRQKKTKTIWSHWYTDPKKYKLVNKTKKNRPKSYKSFPFVPCLRGSLPASAQASSQEW